MAAFGWVDGISSRRASPTEAATRDAEAGRLTCRRSLVRAQVRPLGKGGKYHGFLDPARSPATEACLRGSTGVAVGGSFEQGRDVNHGRSPGFISEPGIWGSPLQRLNHRSRSLRNGIRDVPVLGYSHPAINRAPATRRFRTSCGQTEDRYFSFWYAGIHEALVRYSRCSRIILSARL